MIYLIKVWDGVEKIFEGFSRKEPSIGKDFSAWTDKTDEKGTKMKVNFTQARYRITYEIA